MKLTTRETEVLQLLWDGLSSKEIAERLGISAHTVKNYGDRLREKFGLADGKGKTVLILRRALELGILRITPVDAAAAANF